MKFWNLWIALGLAACLSGLGPVLVLGQTENSSTETNRSDETTRPISQIEQPIGNIAELAYLESAYPKAKFRIDITAVVNNWEPLWNQLFVQQDASAIYVNLPFSFFQDPPPIELGSRLRIVGIFDCETYRCLADYVEVIGKTDPVEPVEVDVSEVRLGEYWSRRVSTQGVVESILFDKKRFQAVLRAGNRRFLARFARTLSREEAEALIGAHLDFDATLAYLEDEIERPIAPITHSMERERFEVTRKEAPQFTDLSLIDLANRPSLDVGSYGEIYGQITYVQAYNRIIVEDEEGHAVALYCCFEGDIQVGDYVRALVEPLQPASEAETEFLPAFVDGLDHRGADADYGVLVLEKINPSFLETKELTAAQVLKDELDLRRGSLTGHVVEFSSEKLEHRIIASDGPHTFQVSLRSSGTGFDELDLATVERVRFTGLIEQWSEQENPTADFKMQVASLSDIEILSRRFSIDSRYVYWLVGGLLSLVFVSGFFVWRLRGQLGEHSKDKARLLARLNATYDAVREGLLLVDARGQVLATNMQFQSMLDLDFELPRAKEWGAQQVAQEIASRFKSKHEFLAAWEATLINPNQTLSLELITVDNPARTLVVFTAPVKHADQREECEIGSQNRIWTFDDISKRKQLEGDLVHSQKMEAVGRLAGGVAHDFNNLLLAINANLELARMQSADPQGPAGQNDYLEAAEKAVDRASKLVKHLLGFSRKTNLELRVQNPHEVLQRIQNLLERILNAEIALRVNFSEEIWNVKMDDTHIEQVLLNLCLNARDACLGKQGALIEITTSNLPQAELAAEIEVGRLPAAKLRDYVRIVVQDNGAGIKEDIKEKVFDPFFTTKEFGKGTGLGLSMSLGIVEQHEGIIQLESEPGKGTRCDLLLPRSFERTNPAGSKVGRLVQTDVKYAHVLLADDDQLVRTSSANALRAKGYEVTTVSNGVDALIHLRSSGVYAVAIVDFSMPGMPAVDLFRKIRESRPELPLIITSGYSLEFESIEEHIRHPVAFIPKPYRLPKLVELINESLSSELKAPS